MTKKIRRLASAGLGLALAFAGSAQADEGMWTFDNFPAETVKTRYGIDIDKPWLERIRTASVRLNGCSAAVVSDSGLVASNHHCIRTCAQSLSDAQHNFVADGFFADGRFEERLCPGMTAEILERIVDVTGAMQRATTDKRGENFVKARDEATAKIEKESCLGKEGIYRCQLVSLYQGGQYVLYTFRIYKDVRLVAAPEEAMAFFGGDPDNFNFPRYDLDFAFLRLYENGHPAYTPNHLKWSTATPKDGEAIFVSGNPGTTDRLMTAAQLDALRAHTLPDTLIRLAEFRGILTRFSAESAENARIARSLLFSVENSFKAFYGRQKALAESNVIAAKRLEEELLKAKVADDPKLAKAIGTPWDDITAALSAANRQRDRFIYLEGGPTGSTLYGLAKTLVRAAQEKEKPDSMRMPGYSDSRIPLIQKSLMDARPVYPELERLALEFWLTKLREKLTADDPGTKLFLGTDSPQNLAAKVIKTRLGDPAFRKTLWDGGWQAVAASNDPMIRFVLNTDPTARAILKTYREKIEAPIGLAEEKIAKARFAVYGTSVYPDATFSPRLSFGKVAGWTQDDGTEVPPFTTYDGLWQRATGQAPFALPPRWQKARGLIDGTQIFNFATTNDIIGGNSGSPMTNADGDMIGIAFDGNIHSLGGAYFFDETQNRTVGVTAAAITAALRLVYRQDRLVKELTRE